MIRKLFTLASAASLLLLLATVVLWVRSHWSMDSLRIERASYPFVGNDDDGQPMYKDRINIFTASTNCGTLSLDWTRSTEEGYLGNDNLKDWREFHRDGTHVRYEHDSAEPDLSPIPIVNVPRYAILFDHLGFFAGTYSISGLFAGAIDYTGRTLSMPLWCLAALTIVLPCSYGGQKLRALRALRRVRATRCVKCGYDLRATPDRCPECGTPVAKQATA